MTLSINIPPEVERRLKDEAARLGMNESEYAGRLIEKSLPPASPVTDQATLDLLAQWQTEDQTSDPAELARRNQEHEELKAALNRNRLESGGPSARKIFP